MNWHQIHAELNRTGFDGSMIVMPFHEAEYFPLLFDKFKREVKCLRASKG